MKYIAIIVLLALLVYVYMHSKSVSTLVSNPGKSGGAGSTSAGIASNSAPVIDIHGTSSDAFSQGAVSVFMGAGTSGVAGNGSSGGGGSSDTAPVINITSGTAPVIPVIVDQSKPIVALGLSSNGYMSYSATGLSGQPVIYGTKNGQTVVVSGGTDSINSVKVGKPQPALKAA